MDMLPRQAKLFPGNMCRIGTILPGVLPPIQIQGEPKTVGLYLNLLSCVALETL